MVAVRIGTLEAERLTLEVLRRAHPGHDDYWDGNWLASVVHVEVGAWRGRFRAELRADEFQMFLEDVRRLYSDLTGTASFVNMDGYLSITLTGNGSGRIEVSGEASDQPGYGHSFSYRFTMDQTFLPPLIRDLEGTLEAFPVLGTPDAAGPV